MKVLSIALLALLGNDVSALPVVTTTSVTHAVPIVPVFPHIVSAYHPAVYHPATVTAVPTHRNEVISSNSHTTSVTYPVSPYVNPHVVPTLPMAATYAWGPLFNKDGKKKDETVPAKAAAAPASEAPKELKKAPAK